MRAGYGWLRAARVLASENQDRYVNEPKGRGAAWDHPDIWHLDGVPWHEAPVPRRWHRCWAQTKAWLGFEQVLRCACGAIRNPFRRPRWLERNTRWKRRDFTPPTTPYIERKQAEVDRWDALLAPRTGGSDGR